MIKGFVEFTGLLTLGVASMVCFSILISQKSNALSKIIIGMGILILGLVLYGLVYLFSQFLF
ncbi:hypothetical protein ACMHYP_22735 [Bacillus cereus]|uniref:hypothetical protein n=1 Tax=Bacillus cereus group TaxID=86661 RepID=UPI0030149A25